MAKQTFFQKLAANIARPFEFLKTDKKAIAMHQNNSLYGQYYGQAVMDVKKFGVQKPGAVTFQQLRRLAKYDSVIRICITVIKKEVSQASWAVVPVKSKEVDEKGIQEITELFQNVNANGDNMRSLLDWLLEDLLTLDAGVWEKVYNAKGEIVEIYPVDGASIKPIYNEFGEMDPENGYVQIVNDKPVAYFKPNEILYIMQNPQTALDSFGYGLSPIESVLLSVQASLNADMHNAQVFSKDNVPPGMIDLGPMNTEEAQKFIATWNATTITNVDKLKFIWGSDNQKKYTPFQQSNKDMQYVEYIDWLTRIKLAAFGLTTIDANITQDVNRSTASNQASITNSRGVRTIKRLIEDHITREIIIPMGYPDLKFQFDLFANLEEKKSQADIDKIYIEAGVVSPTDIARREGFEDLDINSPGESDYTDISSNPTEGTIENDNMEPLATKKSKKFYPPLYS